MKLSFVFMLATGILTTPVTATKPIVHLGDNPSGVLLNDCESDCDSDAECAGDLVCYFRKDGFNIDLPPGCDGSGVDLSQEVFGNDRDFCYDRDAHYPHTAKHYGSANQVNTKINVCEADCKKNSDCAGDLQCFQRATVDPLPPGCVGDSVGANDYCYDPNYVAPVPTAIPSIAETQVVATPPKRCTSFPDPHFISWGGLLYDFHGGCDIVLVKNSCVEIHLRTQRSGEVGWSSIQSVGIKIGSDIIEMKSDLTADSVEWRYYINDSTLSNPYDPDDALPQSKLGGWKMRLKRNKSFTKLRLTHPSNGGYIEVKRLGAGRGIFFGFAVQIEALSNNVFDSCFADSVGMCSVYDKSDKGLYGRDGTIITDTHKRQKDNFGQEWQVGPSDTSILSDISLEPIGEYHWDYPFTCYGDLPVPVVPEPKSCFDLDAGRRLQDVNDTTACPHCHTLWDAEIICTCDTDALLVGCEACEEIYNEDNIEFLNTDPTVKAPTPEPSDSPSLVPSDSPSSVPSDEPSFVPSFVPSDEPSSNPSKSPVPSLTPSTEPSLDPSSIPSDEPSTTPSAVPSISLAPSCEKFTLCDENDVCVCSQFPDPHFTTWNGDRYDFHNECDMIHVTNDHLDMHIRTKALWKNGHYWSGVVQAALRFDDDILELNSLPGENKVSVNGVPVTSDSFTLDDIYPVKNTFDKLKKKFLESLKVKMSGGQYIEFLIHLDTIVIRMDAHGSDFYESKGMTGYWNKPGLVGRDGVTSYDIPVKKEHSHASVLFATEWEVDMNRGDPILFSTPSTAKCADTPEAPPLESEDEDRRLVDMEFAKTLCDRVVAEGMPGREECIFDVLRSNFDEDVLENPEYVDPLVGIERCVAAPEPMQKADESAPSCADLGGECVYRCNAAKYDCRPDAMCIEATDLTVVDAARRRMRKLEFIEGCSCALPKSEDS